MLVLCTCSPLMNTAAMCSRRVKNRPKKALICACVRTLIAQILDPCEVTLDEFAQIEVVYLLM